MSSQKRLLFNGFKIGLGVSGDTSDIHIRHADCLDVAIVGGGIGGTYTGWRLRNRGLNIAIYENTDRVGGRMFSMFLPSVPNVPAELGAMRYVPDEHSTLESLLPQLDLRSKVFQPDSFEKMFYFRSTRLSAEELDSPKLPYNLAPGESRNPNDLSWYVSKSITNNYCYLR